MKFEEAARFCDEDLNQQDLNKIAQIRIAKTKKPKKKQKKLPTILKEFNFRRARTQGFQVLFLLSLVLTLIFQHYEPFNGFVNSSFIEPSMDTAVSLKDKVTQSVSQAFVPTKPSPTPTPTTAPAVVIALPSSSPPAPEKCNNSSILGDYYYIKDYCLGANDLPYDGYTHKFNGETNYTVKDGKVVLVVDTAATKYPLEFSVVESKPLPKKAGEVKRYELSILVDNRQLETVCSENWFARNGRPLNEAFCLPFPEADYLTSLGERVVGRGQSAIFNVVITEGEHLQLSAQSVWTKQYDDKLRALRSDETLTELPKSGNRLMHKN